MPHTHVCRITHPYAFVLPVIALWALKSEKLLVYEHREEGKKVHVHLLIEGCVLDKKQLRNIAQATISKEAFEGQENMSFRAKDTDNIPKYITYMSKGENLPVYNKGYDPEFLEEMRKSWVPGKKTPWLELWEAYTQHMIKPQPITKQQMEEWVNCTDDRPPPKNSVTYEEVNKHAYSWLMRKHSGIYCPQIKNELACLVRTYCHINQITIPSNRDRMLLV